MKQGWEIKKLGEVCETSSGGTPSKTHTEYYEGGNIPWLRSGEVSQGLIYDTELYITAEGLDNSSAKIFPIDTVVIAMYGATVGQVGVLKNAMSTNQAVCGIFPTPKFAPLFLVYYLKAKKSYFLSLAAGGAQPNISQQIIRDTYISIPPREEQERIVAELDCLSGVIEKKREQLRELDALAQSIFFQMFGDPITNEKGWEVKKLGEVCKTTSGGTPSKGHNEYYEGGTIPWLRSGEVNKMYIYDTELFITEEGLQNSSAKWFPENTVVVAMYGATVGQVGILKSKMTTNQAICGIFPNEYFIPTYLYHFLLSKKEEYLKLATGGAQPNISQNIVRDTLVCCPTIAQQQQFAEKIEKIEQQKELIKKSISETENLFNARMDYYFN